MDVLDYMKWARTFNTFHSKWKEGFLKWLAIKKKFSLNFFFLVDEIETLFSALLLHLMIDLWDLDYGPAKLVDVSFFFVFGHYWHAPHYVDGTHLYKHEASCTYGFWKRPKINK
jgi:hypothetical protein